MTRRRGMVKIDNKEANLWQDAEKPSSIFSATFAWKPAFFERNIRIKHSTLWLRVSSVFISAKATRF